MNIKNRYFFIDTFYVNYFEQGWTDNLSAWLCTESRSIRWIDVFKSTPNTAPDAIKGLAVLDPQDNRYNNSLLTNLYEGILIFPDPQPFNPLPSSRFQIAETADLYNTTSIAGLNCNYRYDIIITSKVEK